MDEKLVLMCRKCQKQLVLARVDFSYLDRTFHTDVYRCPSCGRVFVSPELAEGKMVEVETLLEDK